MNLHENEMRAVYADTLLALMQENPKVVCLEADLGKANGTVPKIPDAYPDRFFNTGVAEANMVGLSAGMANDGMIPFCATFTPFATRRVYDQITISVAYADNPVNIVATAPGATASYNGATHMCFQDLAIMRAMPNMQVFCPADCYELRAVLRYMASTPKPAYMQLVRETLPKIFDETYEFDPLKARTLCEGADITLVSTGLATKLVRDAYPLLETEGICIDHLHYPSVKPFDVSTLVESVKKTGTVLTVENQNVVGGLGGAVCEVLAETHPAPVKRLGVPDRFGEVGALDYLVEALGFGVSHIVGACRDIASKKG
jgi:transketolase